MTFRRRAAGSLPTLLIVFVLLHVWLAVINLYWAPAGYSDVRGVYLRWMQQGFDTGSWVGIDTPWVYPIVALLPLVLVYLPGAALYPVSWMVLVTILDLVALFVLVGWRGPRRLAAGWWWTAFLFLLGPIAVGRIDTISVSVVVIAIALLARRPAIAVVLLTVATWIKVWPVALLGAIVLAAVRRVRTVVIAVATSAVIVCAALALGVGGRITSFVAAQTGRGLQIEAPVSVPWLWAAASGSPATRVYFDTQIITYQVNGPATDVASAVMTPLLAIAIVAVALLGVRAARRGVEASVIFPALVLALLTCLIVFNKVGSPQYVAWLAAPLLLMVGEPRRYRVPIALTMTTAVLTQFIYPYLYFAVLDLNPAMLAVLTLRNLLLIALFVWAVIALVRHGSPRSPRYA